MAQTPAINDPWFAVSALAMEAAGYQWDKNLADWRTVKDAAAPGGFVFDRTGGLIAKRRVVLQEDMLYRFAAKKYAGTGADALLPLLNSPWWMNDDRMVLLLDRARTAGVPLVHMARNQLALPTDWTDCDIIVRARLKPRIVVAAHAGPGITAQAGNERFVIATEAPHLFMDQLYIPGLGRQPALNGEGEANARAWFDLSTATSFDPNARGFNP